MRVPQDTSCRTHRVASAPDFEATSRWALVGMALSVFAAWLLTHPYQGLMHDSTLYTLGALARLHPESLATDVFLRFGSQDRYTIFSPIYAATIRLLDLEPAAALLTFLSQCGLFAAGWLVARRFVSAGAALLSIGLLVVMPSDYGAFQVLHFSEDFLTPRLAAEALALAAVAAELGNRPLAACVCALGATLLHPIMASAGIALLAIIRVVLPKLKPALGIGAIALAASVLVLWIAPLERLDPKWLEVVKGTSRFLFITAWTPADWARLSVPVATLGMGLLTGKSLEMRRLCAGALLMAVGCLVATVIYCDWLHIVIFTAVQPWRWLWITGVLAIVLTPAIVRDCWSIGTYGRIATILLGVSWVLHEQGEDLAPALLGVSLLVIAFAAVPRKLQGSGPSRLLLYGGGAVLALVVFIDIANKVQYVSDPHMTVRVTSATIRSLRGWCGDGVVPAALLAAIWWLLAWPRSLTCNLACTALAALACFAFAPSACKAWTDGHFTPQLRNMFAQWRKQIPPHSEVLWPDTPVGAWYLLERPSYWSNYQQAGAIFSRQKALLMAKRTVIVNTAVAAREASSSGADDSVGIFFVTGALRTRAGLISACADPELAYVVSWTPLGVPPALPPIRPRPDKPAMGIYLYRCSDLIG
jgi:hypothetical protein